MSSSSSTTTSVTEQIEVNNGVPTSSEQILRTVAEHPSFSVDWKYRRKLIFGVIYFCGGALVIIIGLLGVCIGLNRDVQPNVTGLLDSIIWSLSLLVGSIIGSYVFGATFDNTTARSRLSNLAANLAKK